MTPVRETIRKFCEVSGLQADDLLAALLTTLQDEHAASEPASLLNMLALHVRSFWDLDMHAARTEQAGAYVAARRALALRALLSAINECATAAERESLRADLAGDGRALDE